MRHCNLLSSDHDLGHGVRAVKMGGFSGHKCFVAMIIMATKGVFMTYKMSLVIMNGANI